MTKEQIASRNQFATVDGVGQMTIVRRSGESYVVKMDVELMHRASIEAPWRVQRGHGKPYVVSGNALAPMFLHHLAFGGRPEIGEVYFLNGDTLDVRACNLRHALNKSVVLKNRSGKAAKSCQYPYINWHVGHGAWEVRPWHEGKPHFIGYYSSVEKARFALSEWRGSLQA